MEMQLNSSTLHMVKKLRVNAELGTLHALGERHNVGIAEVTKWHWQAS